MVEHLTFNQVVDGSIPSRLTIKIKQLVHSFELLHGLKEVRAHICAHISKNNAPAAFRAIAGYCRAMPDHTERRAGTYRQRAKQLADAAAHEVRDEGRRQHLFDLAATYRRTADALAHPARRERRQ